MRLIREARCTNGFTLIEVLLSVSLLALLSVALAGWLRQGATAARVSPEVLSQDASIARTAKILRNHIMRSVGSITQTNDTISFKSIPVENRLNKSGPIWAQPNPQNERINNTTNIETNATWKQRSQQTWRWHKNTLWRRIDSDMPRSTSVDAQTDRKPQQLATGDSGNWLPVLVLSNKDSQGGFTRMDDALWLTINGQPNTWLGNEAI
jgi:prepilin-type N-terminal cleavage/methylation domain-containing protein